MEDIYMLSDAAILRKVGNRLRSVRLKQNITQQALAEEAGVSLSSVKKIEKGEIGSFDSLLRVLRTLGVLDVLQPLTEEEKLSPNEYYRLMQAAGSATRKRAAGRPARAEEPESEW
ncbi:MAG: helix-turn-helix domain-containing protein [Bacteroidales bacterium]|nr:helix-turn-helix domain-containing protein [Bacteroidales bacterium]